MVDLTFGQAEYHPVLAFDYTQAQLVSESWGDWLTMQIPEYLLMQLNAEEAIIELRKRIKKNRKPLADLDWTIHKADWSIAAVAKQKGWLLVTDDQDAPFKQPGITALSTVEFIAQYLQ